MPGFGEGGPWSGGPGIGRGWIDGPMPGYGHSGWEAVVWGLLPALVFGGLLALIVLLFVRSAREQSFLRSVAPVAAPVTVADGALAEARMRYARGEIERDAYLRIAEDLATPEETGRSSGPTTPTAPTSSPPPPPAGD